MKTGLFPAAFIAALWSVLCMAQQETAPNTAGPANPANPTNEKTSRHAVVDLDDGSHLIGTMPPDLVLPIRGDGLHADISIKWVRTITLSKDRKTTAFGM